MAISTVDGLVNALANNSSRIILDKGTMTAQAAGVFCSMWRATGTPGQGAIPTTAAACTKALTGAIQFADQTAPSKSYIGWLWAACSISAQTLEMHDRLAHMGGLSLIVTTPQTVGIDLSALSIDASRIGSADYGDVQWWYEIYTAGGATASSATFNVTFDDGSTGNLNVLSVGGSLGAGRMYSLDALRTTAQQGRNIRGVNTVTLSASTGTAGNFGITATRPRTMLEMPTANFASKADWAATGLSELPNETCLFPVILSSATTSGTLRGGGKVIHG